MDLHLQEKAFLITGGSTGLGYALARELVAEGARVAILARDPERLAAAAMSLRESGGEVLAVSGDVRRLGDIERFLDSALTQFKRVDGVVNNAGTLSAGEFAAHEDKVWEQDISLKLMSAVRLTRLALPSLRESGEGVVLNTLSITAKAPEALSTPTAVSRAAGMALTKALSRELAPDNIRVNAILVGVIESAQLEVLAGAAGIAPPEYYARMVTNSKIPLGRVGRAEEFGALAAFLLSPRASYVTGAAVNLDGGLCPVV